VLIELAHVAVWLAFGLSLVQAVAGLQPLKPDRADQALALTERAALGAFVLVVWGFLGLTAAFVASDFSVALVANNSHTLKPLAYRIAGTWGNHEGSMLLWCLVLTGYGAAAALWLKGVDAGVRARALGVQGVLGVGFLAYLLLASSPFVRLDPAPFQGGDLNPLLQDPALAAHPPLLYLGYVGLSLTFSLAAAGLIEGKIDRAWARAVRPWVLAAWSFLTLGIALGSYWAYYELGWGGWWFWDPVENASFIPWLTAAALAHSLAVTEKRGSFVAWTVFLAVVSFCAALFGAFLVRSGVLTSVHAFALDPERGGLLLLGLVIAGGSAFALFAFRVRALSPGPDFELVSREGMLGFNNLVLATSAATVLFGTVYPLITEAVLGRTTSVGAPYFNLTFAPMMGALMILMPLAPLMAWGVDSLSAKAKRLAWLAAVAVGAGLGALALVGAPVWAAAGVALGLWTAGGAVADLLRRKGDGQKLTRLSRSVWGMQLAHIGIGLLCIGASVETGLRYERTLHLQAGATAAAGPWQVQLEGVRAEEGPNYYADRASLIVEGPGGRHVMQPERRFYPAAQMPTAEVAIRKLGAGDLYIALGEMKRDENGGPTSWIVRVYFKPLIDLIYWGCLLVALGAGLAATDRRRAPRAAAEPEAPAPVATPAPAEVAA
jgi:cytochrome c-type biogenesis protein CcmF